MPTDKEIFAMEAFLSVMKPIVEIKEVICGEKWVTVSAVRPLMYKQKDSDSRFIKALKSTVLADLKTRYTHASVVDVLDKACFLIQDLNLCHFFQKQ